jgi:hypothetical protein
MSLTVARRFRHQLARVRHALDIAEGARRKKGG